MACDIYALSGFGSPYEYPTDVFGVLSGKKKRKAKKAARKAKKKARKEARKEKRAAKKAIKKARKSGDKEALKKAKAAKKAAKKKLKANRVGLAKAFQKVGKGIGKAAKKVGQFVKKSTMLVPRSMFLLLVRLNFRGMARKFSNNQQAYNKFAKTWKKVFGGKESKLKKAIEKGKSKKALFGRKKTVGNLYSHLAELGEVLYENGYIPKSALKRLSDKNVANGLGALGFTMAAVGSAIASAMPIVKKVMAVFKKVGDMLPETADEAQGEEYEEIDEGSEVQLEEEEDEEAAEEMYEQGELTDEDLEDESAEETMTGYYLSGYEDGVIEVEDKELYGLGKGGGLFKKIGNGMKKAVSAVKNVATMIKNKRKDKKAAKKAKKADKKAAKKAKKENKKLAKQAKKQAKQTKTTPNALPPADTAKNTVSDVINKAKNTAKNVINKVAKDADEIDDDEFENGNDMSDTSKNVAAANETPKEETFWKKHKTKIIIGGAVLAVGATIFALRKQIFGGGGKSSGKGVGYISPIDLT